MVTPLKDKLTRQASGESQLGFDPTGSDEQKLLSIDVSLIEPDPKNPRQDLGNIAELADSIRSQGLLNPLVVEPIEDGRRYRIIAGHRRFSACQKAELTSVNCIVRTVTEQQRLELQITENLQRADLNPIDEARSFKRLINEFNRSQREIAKELGKSLPYINQSLRLLSLPEDMQIGVQTSEHLNKSLLLEIAKESDPKAQKKFFEKAKKGELTVRDFRKKKTKDNGEVKVEEKTKPINVQYVIKLDNATVSIKFHQGEASSEDKIQALQAAIESERNSHSSTIENQQV